MTVETRTWYTTIKGISIDDKMFGKPATYINFQDYPVRSSKNRLRIVFDIQKPEKRGRFLLGQQWRLPRIDLIGYSRLLTRRSNIYRRISERKKYQEPANCISTLETGGSWPPLFSPCVSPPSKLDLTRLPLAVSSSSLHRPLDKSINPPRGGRANPICQPLPTD